MSAAAWLLVLLFAGFLPAAPIVTPDPVAAPLACRPALLDDGCAAVCAARPSAPACGVRSDAPLSSACAATPLRRQAGRDDQHARVVRELRPGALAATAGPATGNRAQRAAALWALTRPSGSNPAYAITETQYDVAGQVIAQIDAAGVVSGMLYDSQGRPTVTTVVDSVSGQEIRTVVAYDPQGNRTRVVSPRSFSDDAPGVFETRTAYTGRNLVASLTDSFIPDPESGTDLEAITVTTHFTYTPTGKKQSESNPRNAAWVTQYIYGVCCDRLEQVIDAGGFVTRYAYDAMGRMLGTTDANGNASSTQYDAQGRVIARTDAQGAVTVMAYDDDLTDGTGLDETFAALVADLGFGTGAAGAATLTTGPTGEQTLVIRDSLGRTLRQVMGAETATPTVTNSRYDETTEEGLQVVTLVDSTGAVAKQYVDGSGRLVRAELPGGGIVEAQVDERGQVVAQIDANGVATRASYDDLGRAVAFTDAGGSRLERSYDEAGNVVREVDAFGQAVTRVYDGLNRLIAETDRLGHTTRFTYALTGQIETITDAHGGVTRYAYDARNALISVTYPGVDGDVASRTYDAAGRLRTMTDQRGMVTTLEYDAANRVQARHYSTGYTDSFSYDDAGRLLTAVSGRYGTTITRSYVEGVLHEERQEGPHGSATLTYVYDANWRPVQIALDDGTVLEIGYDARGQIAQGSIDGHHVFSRTYDSGGRILATTFANGLEEQRSYTAANQLAHQTVAVAPSAPVVDLSYAYDANRRKTSEVDAAAEAYQATQNFGYDANDRLVGWERTPRPQVPPLLPEPDSTDTQTWDLDALGNWSTTTRNGVTETRTHSPVHAITTIADVSLVYDANGNLTQDHRGRVSTWDEDNRLVSVSVHDADENVSSTATMVYDALGRRLARTAYGRTTVFVLNGSQVIQERDAPTVVPQADVVSDGTRPDPANPGPAPEGSILDLPGTWHITHQPSWTGIPNGWMADKGRALAERTHGMTYGWERGGSPQALQNGNSFQRGLMPQPELDTLHRLTDGDASATWRCALPNGNYAVVVISGDAQTRAHTNHLLLNGQALTDPDPYDPDFNPGYSGGDFDGWAVDVVVEDGFITLTAGPGAFDPRLCLIEIGPLGSAVDDDLRAKLAGIIERATRRSEGGALHPPSPRTYAYGGDYIDAPLAMRVGSGAQAATYFVHANHLYSPQALTDAAGQVVERYSYTAYGERTVLGGTSSVKSRVGFHHGFTGLRNEGHLLFARNRYFAPEMGRWTSRDPAGYVDGYALYNGYFVPNAMDPEGKFLLAMVYLTIVVDLHVQVSGANGDARNINLAQTVSSAAITMMFGSVFRGIGILPYGNIIGFGLSGGLAAKGMNDSAEQILELLAQSDDAFNDPALKAHLREMGEQALRDILFTVISRKHSGRVNQHRVSSGLYRTRQKLEWVRLLPKGLRPNPAAYISKADLDAHLNLFQGGVVKFTSKNPTRPLGRIETFVLPKATADRLEVECAGDVRRLEIRLGIEPGGLGSNPVRIDIPSPARIRMSNGNEDGANDQWIPGGYTSGNIPEAVVDSVPLGAFSVRPAFSNTCQGSGSGLRPIPTPSPSP